MPFLHERMLIMQVSLVMAAVAATAAQLALPNCLDKCGNVTIPYPFGVTENCSMGPEFFISCTANGAFLMTSNIAVTNISVDLGEIRVQQHRASDCYDKLGYKQYNSSEFWVAPPYTISGTKNKFMAIGCDTYATFRGYRANQERFVTGCISMCDSLNSVEQDSCSGIGCCQTSIPDGLKNHTVTLGSYFNHTYIMSFNPCSYAFVVQEGHISFSNTSFQELYHTQQLPMILNWEIGNESCDAFQETSQNSLCKEHSKCVNRNNRSTGYICQCLPGYEGNPYHPNGCQDIDECNNSNACSIGTCVNFPGNYSCKCPKGYKNEGMNEKTCIKDNRSKAILALLISLGVSLIFSVLLVAIVRIYGKRRSQRVRYIKAMELLEKKLRNNARIFTESEVKEATNNFSEEQRVGDGRYAIVYKGKLDDQNVAIKKSKFSAPIDQKQSTADQTKITAQEQFGDEMMTLYQINHNNVVRLVGCCLATQTPIVVYEFIENGSLCKHIHGKEGEKLSLERRLQIAAQTAGALAYVHHDTFRPIIHGDVKTANILLDENKPKLSDFGASRLVPKDENQESTSDHGTEGYIDPEYLKSKWLTKKSDVYSFGVVLAELLTSQMAISPDKSEAERELANVFVSKVEEGRLDEILDQAIVKGHFETVTKVADLAKRCLRLRGKERPSMREVAAELQGLERTMEQHPSGGEANISSSPKDTGNLVGSSASVVDITTSAECESSMQITPL